MTPDDDIDSMWMEIRPVRLPPAEPVVPEKPSLTLPQHPFASAQVLLSAAGHHGTICKKEFTILEREIGFQCTCGVAFRIGLANTRRTAQGLLKYLLTREARQTTAMRLTHEPHQILLELERLQA
jgi:hypothetical protein